MSNPSAADLLRRNASSARQLLVEAETLAAPLERAAAMLLEALLNGRKLLCCGNGGSASDAAHFCAEISGRYAMERPGFPAINLTADTALLTALVNDYPPTEVFARQVKAQGQAGDVLVVLTSSGKSANIVLALEAARAKGLRTIAFLGKGGGRCKGMADVELLVPSDVTARVQEVHLLLYHTLCEAIDPMLTAHAARGGGG